MLMKRTAIWLLAVVALVMLGERAIAQPAHSGVYYPTPTPNWENASAPFAEDGSGKSHPIVEPFHPVGFEPRFDWFAPAETSSYGRGQKANIGAFFSYERLYWSLAAPQAAPVGSTNNPYLSDPFWQFVGLPIWANGPGVDNRFIGATGAWGNRWELGYVDTDDYGWLVSVLDHVSQGQYRVDDQPTFYFGDPSQVINGSTPVATALGFDSFELPYYFNQFRMKNVTQLNGVELTRFYRARRLHGGGYFEFLYGVRWFNLNDTFWVQADGNGSNRLGITGNANFSLNILDASQWSLRANNQLVGPQIGIRMFRQRQRWVTSMSARFLAAANFQNLSLKANLGSLAIQNPPTGTSSSSFFGMGIDQHTYTTTFSPMGELRVNVAYTVTRSVAHQSGLYRVGCRECLAGEQQHQLRRRQPDWHQAQRQPALLRQRHQLRCGDQPVVVRQREAARDRPLRLAIERDKTGSAGPVVGRRQALAPDRVSHATGGTLSGIPALACGTRSGSCFL